jgi:hypothetical protein
MRWLCKFCHACAQVFEVLSYKKCIAVLQFYTFVELPSLRVLSRVARYKLHVIAPRTTADSSRSPALPIDPHSSNRSVFSIAFRALSSIAFTSTFATGRSVVRLHGNVWPSFYLTLLTSRQQRCALITSHTMRTRSGRQSTDHGRSLCLTCALGFVCFISS